jgi:hypothetical protein
MIRARCATLLLAWVFALGALTPCAVKTGDARAASAQARPAARAHGGDAEHPCHAAPAIVWKAICPCGCSDHPLASTSLGSLGVALLPRAEGLLAARRALLPSPPPPRFVRGAAREVEKVPRVA